MMRFFVDANMPPSLASWLTEQGHDACHAKSVEMERCKDRVIWQYAKERGLYIVTKDEDFVHLSAQDPDGPSVVWVRIGNAVRRVILHRMIDEWPGIAIRLGQGMKVVELR
jgi:predicted nuclease of predicted toxin-antitoxin system